jgi:TPP-dependent pyruvate/acetoin dehydrogenase alpha subunit
MDSRAQYSKSFLAGLYRQLYTIRVFETRCIQLYRQGLIRGYLHPYLGEEAVAVGVCAGLRPQDYLTSTHRGHGHASRAGPTCRRNLAKIACSTRRCAKPVSRGRPSGGAHRDAAGIFRLTRELACDSL